MISIIIPVYNAQKYLLQCLDSILNQTFKDFECICVNDGSTDASLSILEDYQRKDKRIKIISQKNGGISAARNAGISAAAGEYLYFMDNDDIISIDYLANMHKTAEETKCPLVVNPNISFMFSDNSRCEDESDYFEEKIYEMNPRLILGPELHIFVWNKLFKTDLIKNLKIKFPLNTNSEDVYFYYCLMPYVGNFAVVKKGRYYWRQTESQSSKSIYFKDGLDYIDIFKMIKDYYKRTGLEKTWQTPVYYLRQQLFRIPPDKYDFKKIYYEIKDCLKDVVILDDVLRSPEKKFIKDMKKGFLYVYLAYYLRKKIKNKIINLFRAPFFKT
ncbi:MAG: glycosyltransferase family 2 protein [Endomicrobia bacterium]|nr:glycosyltransferase family 2 protein [Endomicrobiia bacterium]